MRKALVWILGATLLLVSAAAGAETADSVFDTLSGLEWSLCSGVGAWSTDLRILADGSFSGEYHDSDMGDATDEYPDGTVYCCSFTGQMSVLEQLDEKTWKLRVDALRTDESQPETSIDGGVRYVRAEAYGISADDVMTLYAPGTLLGGFSEDMLFWTHALLQDPQPDALESWFLYSERNESGFVSYEAEPAVYLPNPWKDMTAEQLLAASGVSFGVPEGAENVVYRYMESGNLAEMQFTWESGDYCARLQPFAVEAAEMPDISGMYFDWENVEDVTVHGCRGTIGQAQCGSEDWVERCLWYDPAAGLAGSLSVLTTDLDGLDRAAVAEQVCFPAQANP